MIQMHVTSGDSAGKVFKLTDNRHTIGRSLKNDIVLSDSTTSREHAELVLKHGQYYINDLGSTHGTFIGNDRISDPHPLDDGMTIRIGATAMQIVFSENQQTDDETQPPPSTNDNENILSENPSDSTITYSMPSDSGIFQNVGRRQHSEILSHLSDAMKAVYDIDELLPTLMDTLFDIFKPDRGAILMYSEASGQMEQRCKNPADAQIRISNTVMEQTINERMSVLISDIASDERFNAAESIMSQSVISAICCPLLGKDQIMGLIYIDSQLHKMNYTKDDLALLNIIAANAAVAIENAQLLQEKVRAERLAAFGVAVAGISHFAKNVIAGIQGSSEIMDKALERDEMELVKKAWPILKRSNKKIRTLVQDMLSYAKPRQPEWENGNIAELLKDIYQNQKDRADSLNVKLQVATAKDFPDTQFDKKMLLDALLNLTTNAIEACEHIAEVSVTLKAAPVKDHIQIEIADTGPGIPPEVVPRLFEPFFSTKGSRGTGLGLAVTQKAIQEHCGKIQLKTEIGKGTTFFITLPMGPPKE